MQQVTGMEALKRCVAEEFGNNHSEMARAIKLRPQTVSEVFRVGKRVPAGWCVPLERATEGRFTRQQFRPDLYPDDDGSSRHETQGAAA